MTALAPLLAKVEAVVIGASAGGVEALLVLLPALPADLTPAVFVVLHLPRERPSLLVDIFQGRCLRPVVEADDKEPVVAGTVYFAPPDYHLLIDAGPRIALSADEPIHYSRPSIDALFESAADVYGRHLLGVLLTGANEDGTEGAQAIQRAGGVTVIQEPESAAASAMPASALRRFKPSGVLPIGAIADLLATLAVSAEPGRRTPAPVGGGGNRRA